MRIANGAVTRAGRPLAAVSKIPGMSELTRVLSALDPGDPHAAERILPLVYDELRELAARQIARENPGHTLQATALVHEAYLRVAGGGGPCWHGRRHFFAATAEAMRRILVEQARRKKSLKRGGGSRREPLDDGPLAAPPETAAEDLIALDDALRQLEAEAPDKARLVKLRYFAGASVEDAARLMGISPATAKRYWTYSRAWLYGRLHGE